MSKQNKTDTAIFRVLAKEMLKDEEIWLNNNASSLLPKYPVLRACKGTNFLSVHFTLIY